MHEKASPKKRPRGKAQLRRGVEIKRKRPETEEEKAEVEKKSAHSRFSF